MTRILITGGTGFIGQHLIPKLTELGYEVFSVEQYFWSSIESGREYLADVNDVFALTQIFRKIKPEVVIHLAAATAVAYSYDHPNEVISTNLVGSINLAEISRIECPRLKQFICPSSAEVYGNNGKLLKREDDNLEPNSPYAVSKEAVERYLKYMHYAYGFPITIFRPFNTYGRIDSHWFVVEKVIYQMLTNEKLIRLGDPDPIRDFLYVDDHIYAYLAALENENAIGETFNLCTGHGISIISLVNMIKDIIGWDGVVEWQTMSKRPLDIANLVGSNEKLRSVLKLAEPIRLEEGLKKTIVNWRNKLGV